MSKWRIPRKLKKKRKLLRLKWAVMYTEPIPVDKYLKEYPKTSDECFTWDIQKPKEAGLITKSDFVTKHCNTPMTLADLFEAHIIIEKGGKDELDA